MRHPLLLVLAIALFASACRNDAASGLSQSASAGTTPATPAAAPTVTLAQIAAAPDAYEGKNVVVAGTYNGACGDGDYYFKDKFDLIEFDIIEPDVPRAEVEKLAKGTRIRLHGRVKVRRHASEDPQHEGTTATAEKTEREAEVRIAANHVEVIK